jgi:predicted enzyme related to lactoylglutathione lyase
VGRVSLAARALAAYRATIETWRKRKMPPTASLAFVGIGVSSMERSVDFYTRVLGMTKTHELKLDHMDEVIVGYKGSPSIVLMHYTDGSEQHHRNNPVKLVFNVPDSSAVIAGIRDEGLEIIADGMAFESVKLSVGLAKDPDGYIIELLAPMK